MIQDEGHSNNALDTDSINSTCYCHTQKQIDPSTKRAKRKLLIGFIISGTFTLLEFVGGFMSNSISVMTDSSHMLVDVISIFVSYLSLVVLSRPSTKKFSFGWHRIEVLASLFSMVLLIILTVIFDYAAVYRIIRKDYEINSKIMLIVASCGVVFNILLVSVLHQGHDHGHNHGHSDNLVVESGEVTEHSHHSIGLSAAFIHVVGDLIQSIGVLIAALIIYFRPDLAIVDPICTFIFSILVVISTYSVMKDIFYVLMEAVPVGVDYNVLWNCLTSIPGVTSVHNVRAWSLTHSKQVIAAHVAIENNQNYSLILNECSEKLKLDFNFSEIYLQVEEHNQKMEKCSDCIGPST